MPPMGLRQLGAGQFGLGAGMTAQGQQQQPFMAIPEYLGAGASQLAKRAGSTLSQIGQEAKRGDMWNYPDPSQYAARESSPEAQNQMMTAGMDALMGPAAKVAGMVGGIKNLKHTGGMVKLDNATRKWSFDPDKLPYEGDWTKLWNKNAVKTAAGDENSMVVMMSPQEFLGTTLDWLDGAPMPEKMKAIAKTLAEGGKRGTIPHLTVTTSNNGVAQAVSHDGRHHALTAYKMGIKEMPVEMSSTAGFDGPSMKWADPKSAKEKWPKFLMGEEGDVTLRFPIENPHLKKQPSAALQPHLQRGAAKDSPRAMIDEFEDPSALGRAGNAPVNLKTVPKSKPRNVYEERDYIQQQFKEELAKWDELHKKIVPPKKP